MVEADSPVATTPRRPLYKSLGNSATQIRLFSFTSKESLGIQLQTIDLKDRGKYEYVALSYEWGEVVSSSRINVNNHETTIRANLYDFLHALHSHCRVSKGRFLNSSDSEDNNDHGAIIARPHCRGRQLTSLRPCEGDGGMSDDYALGNASYFWADALCINQADAAERGAQVGVMDTIYAGAKHVAVYLDGPRPQVPRWPDWRVDSALDILRETFSKSSKEDMREVDLGFGRFVQEHEAIMLPFFSLKYWERLWIVQEFALARDIVFVTKQQTLPLRLFERELTEAIRKADAQIVACAPEVFARKMHVSPPKEGPIHLYPVSQLPMLIHEHVDAKCRDPRDRIYAMLGLVDVEIGPVREEQGYHRWISRNDKEVERKLFKPDYTSSPAELAQRLLKVVKEYDLDVEEFETALYVHLGWDRPWAREVPPMIY